MVELCELKLMHNDMEWPPDMDQHIANLNFERSILDEQSLFSSMNVDPSLISTDSLDMEQLRARCETNKNDYKLTFEDSGQWTQSGIFSSPSKNTTGTCCGSTSSTNVMTTWGRLRDPNEDDKRVGGCDKVYGSGEKTTSMPALSHKDITLSPIPTITTANNLQQQRPASLLANFVERGGERQSKSSDFEYNQGLFMGPVRGGGNNINNDNGNDRWQKKEISNLSNGSRSPNNLLITAPPNKPKRTFADLNSKSGSSVPKDSIAPELKFLALHHEIPNFCQTSISFGEILKKAKAGILSDCEDKLEYSDLTMYENNKKTPDSGLGNSTGPTHIEDWPSLAVLLPKNVVDACSFFKSNTSLLTGSPSSSNSSGLNSQQNNIEAKRPQRISNNDLNIFGNIIQNTKTKLLHPHQWSRCVINNCNNITCDCKDLNTTSEYVLNDDGVKKEKKLISSTHKMKLHAQEISIIGLPIYNIKRKLVENVVEGVADIVRNNPPELLCKAIEDLLNDGLDNGNNVWSIITKLTASGRATNKIYDVMIELDNSSRSMESKVKAFVCSLISLRSLDGWLSYIVLKDNVLVKLYNKDAFLVKANTAYRSLFWRLIESVEWLSVIDAKEESKKFSTSFCSDSFMNSNRVGPSKIPSDSRVPKSSSVPSRLIIENGNKESDKNNEEGDNLNDTSMTATHIVRTNNDSSVVRRTRIPVLMPRPRRTLSCAAKMVGDHNIDNCGTVYNNQQTAYVLVDANQDGMLPVFSGERVRVLSTRGMFSRCSLIRPSHGRVKNGIVLTTNLNLC